MSNHTDTQTPSIDGFGEPTVITERDFPIDSDPLADMSYIERNEIIDEVDAEVAAWTREQINRYN